jgi:hypothetical protein
MENYVSSRGFGKASGGKIPFGRSGDRYATTRSIPTVPSPLEGEKVASRAG